MTRAQRWGAAIAAVAGAAVAGFTLVPVPEAALDSALTPLLCLVCGDRGGVDVLLNVLLFLPWGFGLRLASGSWRAAVGTGALLSLFVELLQLTAVPGRDASLSDLITNSSGAGLGALAASGLTTLVRPDPRRAWHLLIAGAAAVMGLSALSAWLQAPWFGDGTLITATARASWPWVFPGRVTSVTMAGAPRMTGGVPSDSGALRAALREGRTELEARVVSGAPPGSRRWIFLVREDTHNRLVLGQHRRTAVLGVPARSLRFRLNSPTLELPGAFPADTGVPVALEAGTRELSLWITASHSGTTRAVRVALSPAQGWTLVAPFNLGLGPRGRWITALLLSGALLPLGYWAAASRRGPAALATLAAVPLVALLAVPAAGGYQPVHWSEWLAAGSGAAAGWALFRGAAYLQARCGSPSIAESFSS
ncbi:MAG TPA: VanZ family protein [Gemmatimonadales bacterium]